jgi:transposase
VDEAGFSTQPARSTTWGAVGRTPVLKIAGRGWKKISAAGALTVSPGGRGGKRRRVGQFFRLYEHDIDGPTCAEFLRALLRRVRGPVTLIWDGLAVHRAPAVKTVLAKLTRVRVHRLPSYAPELNPVEPMWANGKGVKLRGFVPEDLDDLEIETDLALTDIAHDRRLLRSFFNATPLTVPGVTT